MLVGINVDSRTSNHATRETQWPFLLDLTKVRWRFVLEKGGISLHNLKGLINLFIMGHGGILVSILIEESDYFSFLIYPSPLSKIGD